MLGVNDYLARLLAAPRHNPHTLAHAEVPVAPGVYAFLSSIDGSAGYVGKASSLRRRVGEHLDLVADQTFRRNLG